MPIQLSLATIYNHLLLAAAKKTVICNIHRSGHFRRGHALLYYKTDSLTPGYWQQYQHTNNWEITEEVRILNKLGFWVDAIDRGAATNWLPADKYQLFIGIGIDGSGHHYLRLAQHVPSALKVLYAASSNPDQRNAFINQRYAEFQRRTGCTLPLFRTVEEVDTTQTAQITDQIICVGNHVTNATFSSYHRPIHKIYLSTSPKLYLDKAAYTHKQATNFLFFAGAGNILKGLDLLLETFAQLPNLNLYVCTTIEKDFLHHYQKLIDHSPNIHIENFIRINSPRFNHLTSVCAYVILPSSTEGCATSVTSCMRRGLIPVVTRQSGIDVEPYGFYIDDISIPGLSALVSRLSVTPVSSLRDHVISAFQASFQYTQQSFSHSFTQALVNILQTA